MTRNYVQAINAYKRQAMDKSLMLEGETEQDYTHRMYALGVWRLILVSGIADWAVYKADDLLRAHLPALEADREAMMRHYGFFEDRMHMMTEAPDDYLDDVRYKSLERHSHKLNALLNAVRKEYATLGVPFPEVCATLCLFTNFVIVAREAYRTYVKVLGEAIVKQLPSYPEDALRRLERSGLAADRLIQAIDKERLSEGKAATDVIVKISKELLESIISAEELNRAAEYANKEYRKAEQEAAKKK